MIPLLKQQIFISLSSKAHHIEFPSLVSHRKQLQHYVMDEVSKKNKVRITKLRLKNQKREKFSQIYHQIKVIERLTDEMEKNEELNSEVAQMYKNTIKNLFVQLEHKRRKLAI
jgi:hypothetical protein